MSNIMKYILLLLALLLFVSAEEEKTAVTEREFPNYDIFRAIQKFSIKHEVDMNNFRHLFLEKGNSNNTMDFSKVKNYNNFDREILKTLFHMYKSKDAAPPQVSTSCQMSILEFVKPFMNESSITPALIFKLLGSPLGKLLDSWGKPGSRILVGNIGWLGGYDECQVIQSTRYCLTNFTFLTMFSGGQYGSCFPKTCTESDVLVIHKYLETTINPSLPGYLAFDQTICEEPTEYDTGTIITIVIFSIILLLCLVGSLTEILQDLFTPLKEPEPKLGEANGAFQTNSEDVYLKHDVDDNVVLVGPKIIPQRGNAFTNFLLCFSILKNTRTIFSTKLPKGAIGSINGIRTISMTWVILGHTFAFIQYTIAFDNRLLFTDHLRKLSFMAVGNAYVAVDTFFMLSGLLVAYLMLKQIDKNGVMTLKQYLMYLLHRYIRLTPSLIALILFYVNINPLILSGPTAVYYQKNPTGADPCIDHWWTNLLYINNVYPNDLGKECVGWTWYLANDTQFYIISPLLLIIMYQLERRISEKYRFFAVFGFIGSVCSIFFIILAVLIAVNDYPTFVTGLFDPSNPRMKNAGGINKLYIKPYARVPAYLAGLILGYILSRKMEFRKRHRTVANIIGWCISIAVALSIIYGPYHVIRKSDHYFMTDVENVFFGTFHRFAFVACVGWVVYSCHNKMGLGLVNDFLSWKAWIPLSRLTYGAYLIHPVVIFFTNQTQENAYHFQLSNSATLFVSWVTLSYGLSYIICVFIEQPTKNLEMMIFK